MTMGVRVGKHQLECWGRRRKITAWRAWLHPKECPGQLRAGGSAQNVPHIWRPMSNRATPLYLDLDLDLDVRVSALITPTGASTKKGIGS